MRYRRLGNTGKYVSEITLGTMTFVSEDSTYAKVVGAKDQSLANRMVNHALEFGVKAFALNAQQK